MFAVEYIAPIVLGLIALQQLGAAIAFSRLIQRRFNVVDDDELPEAMVILKLRGADPFLADCLRGLFDQDHPRYRVRVMVDSREDPAWKLVHDVLAESQPENVEVRALVDPLNTCSLVCSALLQATEDLPESCEAIVTLDADVVPHRTWLRELVSPLANPKVGAARGFRWFAPPVGRWGSWVRYLWNMVGVIVGYFHGIGWGGSMALTTSLLRETKLREWWAKAANEDVIVYRALHALRLKMQYVSSLVMANREECGVASCLRFASRQQIWVKLYLPNAFWLNAVVFHTVLCMMLLALGLGTMAALAGRTLPALLSFGAVVGYFVIQSIMLTTVELSVRKLLAIRGQSGARLGLKSYLSLPLTMCCSFLLIWRTILTRRYDWRGIEYEVKGPWNVRLLEYRPYVPPTSDASGAETPSATSGQAESL